VWPSLKESHTQLAAVIFAVVLTLVLALGISGSAEKGVLVGARCSV
jgi:preprotein translocase subunit SecE